MSFINETLTNASDETATDGDETAGVTLDSSAQPHTHMKGYVLLASRDGVQIFSRNITSSIEKTESEKSIVNHKLQEIFLLDMKTHTDPRTILSSGFVTSFQIIAYVMHLVYKVVQN